VDTEASVRETTLRGNHHTEVTEEGIRVEHRGFDALLFNVPALGITHPAAIAPLPYGPSFLEIASWRNARRRSRKRSSRFCWSGFNPVSISARAASRTSLPCCIA
jgi:hypothetical protein